MTTRDSIIDYIDAKAARLRARADKGLAGWALDRRDARVLEILRDDILNGFDMKEADHGE
ncbi:hypothetical protein [Sphingobium baderi]|uniref:Uncharacterized protein n=1 Tax=Sphingobium baderi LL03 TaxID=1114964 RepID=T0HH22_9SPHN|nr:hypothetical protein [Sphingobium baderi]EQA96818.1 hypothetical protein L485_22305 [Sphingobium baderi LL03]KMS64025.1 hypothetical protein V475_23225 [Sphingobium baderi LL03]